MCNGSPRKIVVHSVSGMCPDFSERVASWIHRGVGFLGIAGVDAVALEELADDIALGDGSRPSFLLTTSHPGESLSAAVAFAELLGDGYAGPGEIVEL